MQSPRPGRGPRPCCFLLEMMQVFQGVTGRGLHQLREVGGELSLRSCTGAHPLSRDRRPSKREEANSFIAFLSRALQPSPEPSHHSCATLRQARLPPHLPQPQNALLHALLPAPAQPLPPHHHFCEGPQDYLGIPCLVPAIPGAVLPPSPFRETWGSLGTCVTHGCLHRTLLVSRKPLFCSLTSPSTAGCVLGSSWAKTSAVFLFFQPYYGFLELPFCPS